MKWSCLAVALVVLTPMHAGRLPSFDPADGTVFSAAKARELLEPCSRSGPKGVTGTWQPEPQQIRDLEARLPEALVRGFQSAHADARNNHQVLPTFDRQYAGVVIGGRKLIYINAFPHSIVDFDGTDLMSLWRKGADWRRKPVVICDGGDAFWGALYDPQSKTFEDFEFNGVA
jgi:hypothetical protein